jgi:hypothetical protein
MNRLRNLFDCLCAGLLLAAGRGHAETVFWSDNFEINAGSRWTTNSVWQIGSPTFGPANTHSGSKCATTGLKTSAPANADARFICTNYNGASTLTVPATNQFPRLRFWQWFNFVNAGGYVEIQQSGSTNWQAISATNNSIGGTATYSSGVWSRPSIDLSAFAGKNVQIAFHFSDGGSGWGSDPGWYIDDVAVVTNAPVFNNPESFETGLGDWSVDSGTWEVGKPTSGPAAAANAAGLRANSGTNCAATVLAGNYGWNMDTRLISPPFLVPASGNAALQFWQWYSFVNAGGFVEINNGITTSTGSTNSTITTNMVFSSLNTNIYQLFGAADAAYSTPFYWNQTIGGWTNATKAMGNVLDGIDEQYYFEAGNAPLFSVGGANDDYRPYDIIPIPRSAAATNFLVWQGMTWNSLTDVNDNPVGYFGTNYSYNYTTNTTVTFAENSWQSILQANNSVGSASVTSGGWTHAAVDLSAYAGQTVQVAFHFQSGGSGWGNASGWYVDDVSLVANPTPAPPVLIVSNLLSSNHSFEFSFHAATNTTWRILATTNLNVAVTNWPPIFTNKVGASGTLQFTDRLATNFLHRFYRAVSP